MIMIGSGTLEGYWWWSLFKFINVWKTRIKTNFSIAEQRKWKCLSFLKYIEGNIQSFGWSHSHHS